LSCRVPPLAISCTLPSDAGGSERHQARVSILVEPSMTQPTVSVRYIVSDVDEAIAFYTKTLGFTLTLDARPAFAAVTRGALQLWLSGPKSSGGRMLLDGRQPGPGGWNRIVIEVPDIAAEHARLREAGQILRTGIVTGPGGSQVLLDDPFGNPIELFQPGGR
jgi:catechol 2,3-dioxygenase-like lactoylglutathione lyase family enzyme